MIFCPKCGGTVFIIHHTVGGPQGSVLLECCATSTGFTNWGYHESVFCGTKWMDLESNLLGSIV